MSWLTDRIDAHLNRRDDEAVEEELLVADAEDAAKKDIEAAMDALRSEGGAVPLGDQELETEARLMIARSKAHERQIDVVESDSDDLGPPDWQPPARRERITDIGDGAELMNEGQADEVQ
jgi:hypothetical protein